MKFVGWLEELLGTGRGLNFDSVIKFSFLGLIHGFHEVVTEMQLKPTINY